MNFTNLTKKLWATEISDHFPEDAKIKKLIANVNFGLLEKCTNKSSKGFAFDGLREALYIGYDLESDKELDRKYYCLTVTDRVALRNGYIYIKELLLQSITIRCKKTTTN